MTETSLPVRSHARHISNVITAMSYGDVAGIVRRARGAYLRQLVDAARDVAQQCEWPDLRKTAEQIVTASRVSHPEYWDPTLRGAL